VDNAVLGQQVRMLLNRQGGPEQVLEAYEELAAYHGNNYLPLLWKAFRSHRAVIFRLLKILPLHSTSQDQSVVEAWQFLLANEHRKGAFLPATLSLAFAREHWQRIIQQIDAHGQRRYDRRHLEVCICCQIAADLKSGDLAVPYSQEFADLREHLFPWEECAALIPWRGGHAAPSHRAGSGRCSSHFRRQKPTALGRAGPPPHATLCGPPRRARWLPVSFFVRPAQPADRPPHRRLAQLLPLVLGPPRTVLQHRGIGSGLQSRPQRGFLLHTNASWTAGNGLALQRAGLALLYHGAFDGTHGHSKAARGFSHGLTVSHRAHQTFFQVSGRSNRHACLGSPHNPCLP
jgi:hypothetical protein